MTAPTLSEPRPDDEGRETELSPTCAACGEIIGFREPVQFWELHDGRRYVHAECIRAAIEQARLTPHPAPLGATDEGQTPDYLWWSRRCDAYRAKVMELEDRLAGRDPEKNPSLQELRAMLSRAVLRPSLATDEGLRQAATRHLAEWDKPNADWSVLCETAEAIRAALQATP